MSAETGNATDHTTKGILLDLAKAVQSAEDYLGRAGAATYDPKTANQIRVERHSLGAFLAQLTQALAITDQDLLAKAAEELTLKDPPLMAVSGQIRQIDAATAEEVAVYMEQAVTYIAQAMTIIAELP